MELIGIENTKLTALFLASRAEGQPYLPGILEPFLERYKFSKFPSKVEDLVAEKVSFGIGLFGAEPIDAFEIYPDGVVIASRCKSAVLEAFLEDVTIWMESAAGLQRIETQDVNRIFESHLLVRADPSIMKVIGTFAPIQKLVSKFLKNASSIDVSFEAVGLALAADTTKIASMKPSTFRLERRIGIPFAKNLFISSAPLRTGDHLKVLEAIENLSK